MKELLTALQAYQNNVSDHMDSDAACDRAKLLENYLGEKYGNERTGYSQVVTREVYQTIENLTAEIAEFFVADEETVRFQPEGPEDIEAAKQATDYIRYVFYRKNDGFGNTLNSLKDGLMQRFGVVKIARVEEEQKSHHTFEYLSPQAFQILNGDDEVEITEYEEFEQEGQRMFSGEFVRTCMKSRTEVDTVPSEQFGIERSALTIEDACYCHQKCEKTKSELLAMGFDPKKLKDLPSSSGYDTRDAPEKLAREFDQSEDFTDAVTERYELYEEYIRFDDDGDDFDELLQVFRIGSVILQKEEVDRIPFELWTPIRIPHKLTGLCPADAAIEPQKIKTTLWRNQLDNQYNLNNGRPVVVEGQVDLDSVMKSKPGAPYVVKHPNAISFPTQPNFGQHTYQMLAETDKMLEMNVGSSDSSIDPSILNGNTAAGAVSQVVSKRQARVRLITREFAEFLRRVFMRVYELEIAHADDTEIFRLNGEFVEVDPRTWNARKDVTVLVGLGNGNKNERLFHMQQTFAAQAQMAQSGGLGVTVLPRQIVQLQEDMVRLYDSSAEGRYFTDPGDITGTENQGPSIEEQVKLGELQLKQQEAQHEHQLEMEQLKLEAARLELEKRRFEADNEFKIAELNLEARQERAVKVGS